eukprot:CAMPEP_0183360428 /NCGR_PEP_ID=MMETSP0164_2-20130417/55161_1 /TAXON_ID=221442 /ORGANISM="Coccolithus pelagicus ssp braarudi, Strain PLY182g" /LENGTH=221 /DNA_ID=CAMNT_0025534789 /DNA_START=585 /DNA_END=1252 /DNA_ORIENTATION=+
MGRGLPILETGVAFADALASLELVLAKVLELLADAAGLRTESKHRRRILLALALAAQSRHASSLSKHTWLQTSQVWGQSRIMADGLFKHSSFPQISHCVVLTSAQTLEEHTSQLLGQVLSTKPGFFPQPPSAAQPGQSLCVSVHLSLQTPHEIGQCLSMKSGFSPHAPALVHESQFSCASLQVGVQSPHEVGHALYMKIGLLVQWPAFAQLPQSVSVSLHS